MLVAAEAKRQEGADVLEGAPALRDAEELGPRFAAVVGRPRGWIPATELFGDRLAGHVATVAENYGASTAVAGTLLLQQHAAIVAAPVLAALHREGRLLTCGMPDVRLECVGGRPVRVAFERGSRRAGADHASLRRDITDDLLYGHLLPAATAVHTISRAGTRVLNGVVAYAVATAYLQLSWRCSDPAQHLDDAREALARAGLDGLVDITTVEVAGARWLHAVRRTCCLAFRTARHRRLPDPYCSTCPASPDTTIAFG